MPLLCILLISLHAQDFYTAASTDVDREGISNQLYFAPHSLQSLVPNSTPSDRQSVGSDLFISYDVPSFESQSDEGQSGYDEIHVGSSAEPGGKVGYLDLAPDILA